MLVLDYLVVPMVHLALVGLYHLWLPELLEVLMDHLALVDL